MTIRYRLQRLFRCEPWRYLNASLITISPRGSGDWRAWRNVFTMPAGDGVIYADTSDTLAGPATALSDIITMTRHLSVR